MTPSGAPAVRLPWIGSCLLLALAAGCATSRATGAAASPTPAPASPAPAPAPAAPQASVAPPASPFDGCRITGERAEDRLVECEDIVASASDEDANAGSVDDALGVMLDGFKKSFQGTVQSEKTQLTLAGQSRAAIRFTGSATEGTQTHRLVGTLTTFPAGPGKIRLLSCAALDPTQKVDRCGPALEALARALPDVNAEQPEAEEGRGPAGEPLLAGRKLAVPDGCRQLSAERIRCDTGELTWHTMTDKEPPGLEWIMQPLREGLGQKTKFEERALSCRIDGVATTCREVSFDVPTPGQPMKAKLILGRAEVRGQSVIVQCNLAGSVERINPPCDQVLQAE